MPLNEGQTVQYTVITTRVADGTVLYWKTTGNTTNSDIVGGNTGSVTITNNQGVFNVTTSADLSTDGTKTLGISLSTGSVSGPAVVTTTSPIVIDDTSQTPVAKLYAWGINPQGILGTNDTINKSSPTQVGTANWKTISSTSNGARFSAAIQSDGTLWTWGANISGCLGLSDGGYRSSPTQFGTLTKWSKVTTGSSHVLATRTDGTLWTWGDNGQGQLGLGNRVYRSSPVQIGTGTDWATIPNKTGSNFNFAIKTNGTLWAWGAQGFAGVFGISQQTGYRSSPIQVGTDTNWSKIETTSASHRVAAAIRTNGTLWLWGDLRYGLGGVNLGSIYRSSPIQVGTGTTWSTINLGREHWLATQTNNTLWGCGRNDSFALGIPPNGGFFSSPVQIGSDTNWSQVSAGFRNSWAIKTNGTLWAWGQDNSGALGFNTNYGDKNSPTQIGTSTWQLVYNNGYRTTFAISNI